MGIYENIEVIYGYYMGLSRVYIGILFSVW